MVGQWSVQGYSGRWNPERLGRQCPAEAWVGMQRSWGDQFLPMQQWAMLLNFKLDSRLIRFGPSQWLPEAWIRNAFNLSSHFVPCHELLVYCFDPKHISLYPWIYCTTITTTQNKDMQNPMKIQFKIKHDRIELFSGLSIHPLCWTWYEFRPRFRSRFCHNGEVMTAKLWNMSL